MSFYSELILPRLIDWVLKQSTFQGLRDRYFSEVGGATLEIGFGSGLNLPHYSKDKINSFFALEPSKTARKLAKQKIDNNTFPIKFLPVEKDEFPVATKSLDSIVTAWTLCSLPEVENKLKEMLRVLKEDGKYYFIEHGLSDDENLARWQDRWNPIQKKCFGGCHVNRPIKELITDAGFQIEHLDTFFIRGPRLVSFHYAGWARK